MKKTIFIATVLIMLLSACWSVPSFPPTELPATSTPVSAVEPVAPLATPTIPAAIPTVEIAEAAPTESAAPAIECPAKMGIYAGAEDLVPEYAIEDSAHMTLGKPTAEVLAMMESKCVDPTDTRLPYMHSGPGILTLFDATNAPIYSRAFDKNWLATVELPAGYHIEVSGVTWNDNSDHYDTWFVMYNVPGDLDFKTAGTYVVYRYLGYTGDTAIDLAARTYWELPADFSKGEDPAPYAVFVDRNGVETVFSAGDIK